ncbi:hypothetical protein EV201_1494 [Ancylomarina subtilis]|uniref:Uncharacterized protein n=1 Tax=Ancylomarina subtilis TaxID=1639035 RepID=A0A4Q7VKT7_9BACT|nr:hypothetical protein [Ancylomarina subtilis]RZT96843.1 hypothetical protein EV201_1494 [Ancylomarina subtilis]
MIKLNEAIADFLVDTKFLLNKSISDTTIKQAVGLFGYDELKFVEVESLISMLEELYNTPQTEYDDYHQTEYDFQRKLEIAHENYMDLLLISKVAFKDDANAQQALGLNQNRKISYSGWCSQALDFCNRLISKPDFKAKMEAYGQDSEKVVAVKNSILNVQSYFQLNEEGRTEAQHAIQIRDEILDLLIEWVRDYKKTIKNALIDQPEMLEQLGLLEESLVKVLSM